ncbi:zinc finger, CCHC-type containing protein [Tanacetum coccineum]
MIQSKVLSGTHTSGRRELVEALSSQPVGYYLKHKINEKLIEGLIENHRFNDSLSAVRVGKMKRKTYNLLPRGPVYEAILKKKVTKKEDIRGNFEIPYNIGGLKHMNALVDQGSDINIMPLSTYEKLTNERPTETDIRLSLASHSYIYPLGITEDVLVDVVGHVDFVILNIREDKKRPFIFGIPFLTIAKAVIKFDKGTIILRSGKILMEQRVKVNQKAHILELKRRNHEEHGFDNLYAIWDNEDVHDLEFVETEFPTIVFNDTLTSEATLSCEPTVSSLNDEIDFRFSFDDSDDEDYTTIFDKNSLSYKIIYVNDLKMDSENDNEKVNMPSFPSPEPMITILKTNTPYPSRRYGISMPALTKRPQKIKDQYADTENRGTTMEEYVQFETERERLEFPAIVFNDALTSKPEVSSEPTVSPHHVEEVDLKIKISFSKSDDEDYNVIHDNDSFSYKIISVNDLKSDTNNNDDKINVKLSSENISIKPLDSVSIPTWIPILMRLMKI